MLLREAKEILGAEILSGEEYMDRNVEAAFSCDLMSDVLAFVDDKVLLLTGLTNMQVIRTAEMLDLSNIVFVRGKKPNEDVCKLAKEKKMVLMGVKHTLFEASGLLYKSGLDGIKLEGD
jgi:predicted transcriptional regulator